MLAAAAALLLLAAVLLPGGAWGSEAAAPGQAARDGVLTVSLPYYSLTLPEGSLGRYKLSYDDGPLPSALDEGGHAAWASDSLAVYTRVQFASNETHGLSVNLENKPSHSLIPDFEVFCYAGEASSGTDGSAVWVDAGALSADGLRIGVRVRVAEASGDGTASGLRSRLDDALGRAAEYASWVGGPVEGEGGVGLALAADEDAPGGFRAHLFTPYYAFDLPVDVTEHGVGFTYDENGTKPGSEAQAGHGYLTHAISVLYGAEGDWVSSARIWCRTEQDYIGDGPDLFLEVEGARTSADGLLVEIGVAPYDPYRDSDPNVDYDALTQAALERADAIAATVEVK